MLVATVILSLAVALVAASVGFVIYKLLLENRELKRQVRVARAHPSMIGITYKTDSDDVHAVINSIKALMAEEQKATCPRMRTALVESGRLFVKRVSDASARYPSTRCSELSQRFAKDLAASSQAMAKGLGIAPDRLPAVQARMKDLLEAVLKIICVGDKIDAARADGLFEDIFDAVCPV